MYTCSCLLQNDLGGGEMLLEMFEIKNLSRGYNYGTVIKPHKNFGFFSILHTFSVYIFTALIYRKSVKFVCYLPFCSPDRYFFQ